MENLTSGDNFKDKSKDDYDINNKILEDLTKMPMSELFSKNFKLNPNMDGGDVPNIGELKNMVDQLNDLQNMLNKMG